MKKQIVHKIKDCNDGGRAELVLLIDRMYYEKRVIGCSRCHRSICLPSCNEKDYIQKKTYAFDAIDDTGMINLRITHWSNVDGSKIQPKHLYKVIGEIRGKYNNKFDLIAEKIEEVKKVVIA